MQSIAPLTASDFNSKVKVPISKLEIFVDPTWINICDLDSKNYLISLDYSRGQKEHTFKPLAASFSARIDNLEGIFHPQNSDSAYKDYFKVGRKVRFSTGFEQGGTDYFWQWFIGVIAEADLGNREVQIQGLDYVQYLSEVRLKSPDNYWGAISTESIVADQVNYSMPGACNGIYIAYLDGVPIYDTKQWVFDRAFNDFVFMPEYIPTAGGVDNLLIYYFTDQIPEEVIADLLMTANLYVDQAAALAAMDYTATGITIERVWFASGSKLLNAVKKICERVDYRFFFGYDGTPVFKPIPTAESWSNRDYFFSRNLIARPALAENIDEIKNNIVIEGERYPVGDAYFADLKKYSVLVTATVDGGFADATWAAYPFSVAKYDTDDIWDVGDPNKLTCKTPGTYKISGFFTLTSNAAGIRGIRIRKNGVGGTLHAEHKEDAEVNTNTTVRAKTVLDLIEGDYVELMAYHNSGGLLVILAANEEDRPEFEMERIG